MPEDDVTKPPVDPPGDPGNDPPVDPPKDPPSPPEATFKSVDVQNIVRNVISELTPKAPIVAAAPAGPDPTELRGQINTLDTQIDQAVQEGKPIAALQRKRDELRDQIFEVEHVTPLRTQGAEAINGVVLTQMKADPELGDLFKEYETEVREVLIKGLRPGQTIMLDWVKDATRMVAGRHLTEIRARDKDATLRQQKLDTQPPLPGASNGRTMKQGQEKLPETIIEQFGDRAAESFRSKERKGYTADTFARTQGFQNREEWFKRDRELADNPTLGLDK